MAQPTYKQITEPTSDQVSEIVNGLNRFGLEQIGGKSPARVAVVCKGKDAKVIGGAIGYSLLERFYLTQLWVAEEYRSKGIGTELVKRVETIAIERTCHDVVVDTLNAKAVQFYERLSYTVYSVNKNYIRGFDWYFLGKPITELFREDIYEQYR